MQLRLQVIATTTTKVRIFIKTLIFSNINAIFATSNVHNSMKRLFLISILFIVLTFAFSTGNILQAQISHGGIPLFHTPASSLLKSSGNNNFFIEMPSFDVDSLLKEDELDESNMRSSFRFAHKFHVNIEKGKTGYNYVLQDGTKIWQTGIRSAGAYSINVFFSEYKVPEGGKLFLYNSSKTHVIGSFTHENNSEDNILPIQPVFGDEIIIEYQEPADAKFEAKLKITEVNHDYRGILNYEPQTEPAGNTYACMLDVLCAVPENNNIRSVVLVIINGTVACTGTLLNTTNDDGEPVLLTAVHCLNDQFQNPGVDYAKVAGTIVCFFNYRKPVCNQTQSQIRRMKGSQEMSIAGATPLSIAVKNDMALLRLNNKPPDYYQAYFAGWNVNPEAGVNIPFVNIHHPKGFVSKYGNVNTNLTLTTYPAAGLFNPVSHWKVSGWSVGSTESGSSGSPLFDNQGLLVGGLTGGQSLCTNKLSDYFFALYKSWEYLPDVGIPLKDCLDPNNLGISQYTAYDPNSKNPLVRLRNGDYNNGDELLNSNLNAPQSGLIFGHNSICTKEFAEEFTTEKSLELVGVYLLAPVTSIASASQIKVKVYKNALSTENLVASEKFYPTYTDYYNTSIPFVEKPKTMDDVATESFVKFQNEVETGTKFYVSYEITYPSGSDFSVFNMIFDSPQKNSAWLCGADGKWFPATEHPNAPVSASLTIEPLVRYKTDTSLSLPVQKKDYITYIKASQQLQINTSNPDERGIINLYSVAGQLLCKIPYLGNNPVSVPLTNTGNIVIVKALSENGVKVSKVTF